ncbi:hypothetical protein HPB50_017822 [Hyalomma asiaticum]|uniref:Uncharacterized protein n=1 Tax=Hyalomma asiaticum TaxID=266040 RepID=A0ACB7T0A0_HYAAI|nr:hypothetical protein HPB50_017822 [Hyalomma asiaticum]
MRYVLSEDACLCLEVDVGGQRWELHKRRHAFSAYAQHRNQLTQATQPGVNQRGYPAAPAPQAGEYDVYASLFQNAAPYSPGYSALVQHNNRPFGARQDASGLIAAGPYGYPPDTSGSYRQMNYGDAVRGFRANLPPFGANQPGAAPGVSNIAAFNAAPILQPVPTGSAQEAAAAAYGPRAAAPNAVGYGGYGPSTSGPVRTRCSRF